MLNKKPLLGLAVMSALAANVSVASANDDEASHQPVSGDVIFSGSVDSQCGVYATQDRADLAFGDDYNQSHATVKLISNTDEKVKLSATDIDISSFGDQIDNKDIHIQSAGTIDQDKSLDHWERGVDIERSEIESEDNLNLYARVNVDEGDLQSGIDYQVKTTWTVECN
ncbi:hypothetical protein [Vibrio splendidus]|uniref:hypothetical protein n=1 Tax=Vibrio splendidus TaxID=29497 RepID=UPI000C823F23|nr:hypothetical protein [Vibrio splendidus]PMM10342.1 hypothetical protein BCT62_11710 [Vibrio splendidus]PMN20095.1 hypothetical protein BCT36_19050 [Vibrio splendidus]